MATTAELLDEYARQLNAQLAHTGLSVDASSLAVESTGDATVDLFVPYVHGATGRRFEFRYPLTTAMLAPTTLPSVLRDVVTHDLNATLRYVLPYMVEVSAALPTATIVCDMDARVDELHVHVTPYRDGVALGESVVSTSLQAALHASAPTAEIVKCVPRRDRPRKCDLRLVRRLVRRYKRGLVAPHGGSTLRATHRATAPIGRKAVGFACRAPPLGIARKRLA